MRQSLFGSAVINLKEANYNGHILYISLEQASRENQAKFKYWSPVLKVRSSKASRFKLQNSAEKYVEGESWLLLKAIKYYWLYILKVMNFQWCIFIVYYWSFIFNYKKNPNNFWNSPKLLLNSGFVILWRQFPNNLLAILFWVWANIVL